MEFSLSYYLNLSQIAQIAQILLIQGLIDDSTDRGTDIICIEVD